MLSLFVVAYVMIGMVIALTAIENGTLREKGLFFSSFLWPYLLYKQYKNKA